MHLIFLTESPEAYAAFEQQTGDEESQKVARKDRPSRVMACPYEGCFARYWSHEQMQKHIRKEHEGISAFRNKLLQAKLIFTVAHTCQKLMNNCCRYNWKKLPMS